MAAPGFYDHNEGISYPFIDGSIGFREPTSPVLATDSIQRLPTSIIVDAGFMFAITHQAAADEVLGMYLEKVERTDSTEFTFTFRPTLDATVLPRKIVFCRDTSDPRYSTDWQDFVPMSGSDTEICGDASPGEGFCVFGEFEDLETMLPLVGDSLNGGDGEAEVEPSLVQNLNRTFIRSLAISNNDRTRSSAPEGCPAIVFPQPPSLIDWFQQCLSGHVRLEEGHNASISVNEAENSITIGAVAGGGAGEVCEEIPLHPVETPPSGSQLLSGGPTCNEVLRSINGIGQRFFNFEAGQGVVIEPNPLANKVVVKVELTELAICDS